MLAGLVIGAACGGGGTSPPPSSPPPSSGLTIDEYLSGLNTGLDDISAQVQKLPQHPLRFSANLFLAHEAFIAQFPVNDLLLYVDALVEAGVHRIDINMGLFPWSTAALPAAAAAQKDQVVAAYDAIVQRIRDARVQLVINPQYSPTYYQVTSFDEWQQMALPVYTAIAQRYKPDILVVAHEPTTMAGRIGVSATPEQWASFAQAAARAVKAASPKTRCGAGGLASEETYYKAFLAVPEIDVMTLDIYELKSFPTYNEMISLARAAGKPVYIEETWRPAFVPSPGTQTPDEIAGTGVGDQRFESVDGKWIQTLSLYAGALGLEAMTPSWTQTFFKYVAPGGGNGLSLDYNQQVMIALENGERTSTFFAFESAIAASVPPTSVRSDAAGRPGVVR